jgi:hypothetical protein
MPYYSKNLQYQDDQVRDWLFEIQELPYKVRNMFHNNIKRNKVLVSN